MIVLIIIIIAAFWTYQTHKYVKNVIKYESTVNETLKNQGLEGDTSLVLGIIYTETKGKSVDVMQSSESLTGQANSISNESDSMAQGIKNLAEILDYAETQKVDVWTGVQAYNFGKSYVDYIAKNGGVTNIKLAKKYSRDVVAPSLGNTTGEDYYHITVDSLLYNKGKLYVDGGNMFYAREVKFHMFLLKLFLRCPQASSYL